MSANRDDLMTTGEWAIVRDLLPHAVYVFDIRAQKATYSNKRTAEWLGYGPESPENMLDLLHPEDAERLGENLKRWSTAKDGDVIETEYRLKHKDGGYRWFLSRDRVLSRDDKGNVQTILGTTVDITARRAAQQDHTRTVSLEAMGRLAGGVAHDFNNLLTVILSTLRLARLGARRGESVERELSEIETVAREAAQLTKQLLLLSSAEHAVEPTCDPVSVVRETAPILRRLIEENVEIVYQLDESSPGAAFRRSSLVQILLNLAVNARDAMPRGGTITIAVGKAPGSPTANEGRDPAGAVALTVTDTGEGMTQEVIDRIFDPFFSTKDPAHGAGLGLATVDQLVRQGGGRVDVRSHVGKGTEFCIELPARPTTRASRVQTPAVPSLAGVSVLLCEDNDLVRRVTKTLLEEAGCAITLASNGAEALSLIEGATAPFDLVFSDVVMPKRSGFDLVGDVRKRWANVPILLWTGYPAHASKRPEGRLLRVLDKPVEAAILYQAIRELLGEARREQLAGDQSVSKPAKK